MNPIILIAGAGLLFLLTSKKSTPTKSKQDPKISDSEIPDSETEEESDIGIVIDPKINPQKNPPVKPFVPPNTTKPKPSDSAILKVKGFTLKNCKFKYTNLTVGRKWAFTNGSKYGGNDFTTKLWDGCNLLGIDAVFTQKEADAIYELLRNAVSGSVKSGYMSEQSAHINLDFFAMKSKTNGLNTSKWKTDLLSQPS